MEKEHKAMELFRYGYKDSAIAAKCGLAESYVAEFRKAWDGWDNPLKKEGTKEKMSDKEFVDLCYEKREIVSGIQEAIPADWYWMIVEETETKIVVEVRKIGRKSE